MWSERILGEGGWTDEEVEDAPAHPIRRKGASTRRKLIRQGLKAICFC